MQACPFQVPRYEWGSTFPRVQKCKFCAERLAQGLPTACSEACPTGATKFGERDSLIKEAYERMLAEPEKYIPRLYGEKEVGGTSILYLSAVPFEQLGFKTELQATPLPALTWNVLSKIPNIVTVGGAMLFGIYWITNRREEVRLYEQGLRKLEGKSNGSDNEQNN
jgi:formate dehydrogenase iron-sulfur subunit